MTPAILALALVLLAQAVSRYKTGRFAALPDVLVAAFGVYGLVAWIEGAAWILNNLHLIKQHDGYSEGTMGTAVLMGSIGIGYCVWSAFSTWPWRPPTDG